MSHRWLVQQIWKDWREPPVVRIAVNVLRQKSGKVELFTVSPINVGKSTEIKPLLYIFVATNMTKTCG